MKNTNYRLQEALYQEGLSDQKPKMSGDFVQKPWADGTNLELGKALLAYFRNPERMVTETKEDKKELGGYFSKERLNQRFDNAINKR